MSQLAERPVGSLGYGLRPDAEPDPALDRLIVVLDAPMVSHWAPTGFLRHVGMHVAVDPQSPDRYIVLYASRNGSSAPTGISSTAYDRLDEALDHINGAVMTVSEWELFRRPNAVELTENHWRRALDAHPADPRGLGTEDLALGDALQAACERFAAVYERYGGWRYHGRPDATDPAGYAGPLFWQEEDVRFRFALELEREFPGGVHLDSLLSTATVRDWEPEVDGRAQHPDVLVDDVRGFVAGDDALEAFAARRASLLAEIKFIRRRRQARDVVRDVAAIHGDVQRLARHVRLGRCRRAVMLVVDDDDHFLAARECMPWPAGVDLVRCGPPRSSTRLPRPWGAPDREMEGGARRWAELEWPIPRGYIRT